MPNNDYPNREYADHPGYVPGSDTSEAAAESLRPDASRLRLIVRTAIASRGQYGMTCDEIEVADQMRHQTASARIRELVLKGVVTDSGRRRVTRSGRLATVWVLIEYAPGCTAEES